MKMGSLYCFQSVGCNPTQMSSLLAVVERGSTGLAAEETLLLGDSMTHSGLTRNLVITYNKIRNSGIKDFQYLFTSMICTINSYSTHLITVASILQGVPFWKLGGVAPFTLSCG